MQDGSDPGDAARAAFAARRARLAETMRAAGGGVAVLPTAPERLRNGDENHPYRAGSDFVHLTGFAEPEAWLVVESCGRSTLVCRPKDPETEVWDGVRLGPLDAPAALGVEAAVPLERLDETVVAALSDQPALWLPEGAPELQAALPGWLARVGSEANGFRRAPASRHDLVPLLAEMRLVKDAHELAAMRRAAAITADAHVRVMRFCAARFRADPAGSIPEHAVEAELLHAFRSAGADGPAYGSVVAAGRNACTLHHVPGRTRLQAGELLLVDAGAEWEGYAADVTRTFPATGRWTGEQRAVYEVVLAAQEAAIAATRPGARRTDAHAAAVRVLTEGMLALGLLDRDRVGTLDDAIASAAYRRFYMHGTGHWLGRDVHDAGSYVEEGEEPVEQPDWKGGRVVKRPSRVLVPGMVTTVEPGLYVRPGDDVDRRWWWIGVRIEDDAVVTADGCELLTRGVPVDPDAIEALMAER
jgi:Xaa-Pro aminopeptidase